MRKTTIGITLIILAMVLTACGSSNSSTANGAGSTTSSRNGGSTRTATLTPTSILAIGTFKLEGTPQAVDATEAAKLIPLWQLMNQLDASSSTAPQEVTATVNAIQAAMTPTQVQAINGMQISSRDIFTVLQQSGALPAGGFGGTGQNGSGSTRTGNSGFGGSGNFGGGNRNGGGGGGGAFILGGGQFGGANPTGTRTPSSTGAGTSGNGIGGFNNVLITQLIKLLQAKVQPS